MTKGENVMEPEGKIVLAFVLVIFWLFSVCAIGAQKYYKGYAEALCQNEIAKCWVRPAEVTP